MNHGLAGYCARWQVARYDTFRPAAAAARDRPAAAAACERPGPSEQFRSSGYDAPPSVPEETRVGVAEAFTDAVVRFAT